jgi:hypothetical protein
MNHSAVGDNVADDLPALVATLAALPPAGGLVFFPAGKTFKKNDLLVITTPHVKLWAPNGQATLFGAVNGTRRTQSTLCRNTSWCGVFGLKFTSDAVARFDALEDNQLSFDHATDVEVTGVDINGSAAAGMFFFGASQRLYVQGNFVHLTWADHIHHTDGTRSSWVWDNFIFNQPPSSGDDGIACVTYGPTSPKCGDMEWWNNVHLGSGWGRGYSVIGGDHIDIHHNWASNVAGAGVIVASEPSYNSASSNDLTVRHNQISQCGQLVGHPNILVSGMNTAAPPLTNVAFTDNVSVNGPNGNYTVEGSTSNVTDLNLSQNAADLTSPAPTLASVVVRDTSILETLDTSFVASAQQPGLYRLHVRVAAGGGFEQRFEYVVKGASTDVSGWTTARLAAGDHLSEQRDVGGVTYALVLAANPLTIPSTLAGVSFTELRAGDSSGQLSWLWARINTGTY